jgi:hypothetical protein
MSGRWANLVKPAKAAAASDADKALSERLQAVQGLAAEIAAPEAPDAAPGPRPKERMLDRRDGRARPMFTTEPGKIRGGKRSDQWGRASEQASRGDWVGVCLPPGYNARIKQMAAAHDLYVWQVLTEAVDLFVKTHGEKPKA